MPVSLLRHDPALLGVIDLNARNFVNLFDRAYSPLTLLIFLQVRK